MKTKRAFSSAQLLAILSIIGILFLGIMAPASFAFGGQGNGNGGMGNGGGGKGQGKNIEQQQGAQSLSFNTQQGLSDFEETALAQMGEEEFLALDVYLALYEKWGLKNFSNIAQSEQRHADQVITLTDAYEIENFSDHQPGVFEDEHLQQLYTDLMAKGSLSEVDALTVGAIIEDLDIYDLEKFLEGTQNTDVKKVFENLNMGSRNHMRAFISQLEKRGETYTPQYIATERFAEIISGEHEQGEGHNQDHAEHGKSEISPANQGNQKGNSAEKKGFWSWVFSLFE